MTTTTIITIPRKVSEMSIDQVYLFMFGQDNPNILPNTIACYLDSDKLNEITTLLGDLRLTEEERSCHYLGEGDLRKFFLIKDQGFRHPVLCRVSIDLPLAGAPVNLLDPVVLEEKVSNPLLVFLCSFGDYEIKEVDDRLKAYSFIHKPRPADKITFGLLSSCNGSVDVTQYPLNDNHSARLNLELNYGEKFISHYDKIVTKLKDKTGGLFIFHGCPGSGKTTFIKYLAHKFGASRPFIFVPPSSVSALSSPSLMPVLFQYQNSVLVLEDAENAVVSRDEGRGNEDLVTSILNLGDGILGSILNFSIILTFNTKKDNIDRALLRKGRLAYEYEFTALDVPSSQKLIDSLNKDHKATEPMVISDIYGLDDETNQTK